MNLYSTAIISTGLFWMIINPYGVSGAIAKQAPDDPIKNCHQIKHQALIAAEPVFQKQDLDNRQLIASTATNPDATQSSFWWAALQFDPFNGELVQNWMAYPQKQQVNVIVNWQLWTLLDYFGRYRFVNQFGTVARKQGYSLNVFSQKDQCLASYKYNSSSVPPKWELNMEESGQSSLPIETEAQIPPLY